MLADLKFALRTLIRRRTFFIVAITTLALGIGAATSIFSVVDGVLFRPLAFAEPGKLVTVYQTYPEWRNQPILARTWENITLSVPEYRDWRAQQTSFSDVAIYNTSSFVMRGQDAPELVPVYQTSASLLTVLRKTPVRGRDFLPGEDVPNGPRVALVSHEAWHARYGADSAIVGKTVQFETHAYEIIGVLPPGLSIRRTSAPPPQFWIPIQDSSDAASRRNHSYQALARLKPGADPARASLETARIINAVDPHSHGDRARINTLQIEQTRDVRKPLLVILAAVTLLLLIACVNVATLLVGEAVAREQEMATRVALGAGRVRLVRQLLTESLTLAGLGALLGTALAYGGTRVLVALAPARIPGLADVRMDVRVLAVALGAAAITGLLFGLAPALMLSKSGPASLVRSGTGQSARGRGRLQRGFVAVQHALSVVLLVGAGLLSRSFAHLTSVDPGFQTERLLVARTAMPRAFAVDEARRLAYYGTAIERLSSTPGVVAASGGTNVPLTGSNSSTTVEIEGLGTTQETSSREAQQRVALPTYFATLGIPLRAGRLFTDDDRVGTDLVAIVSESMARRDWPNASPIGKRVRYRREWRTVVGVVGDVKFRSLSADVEPTVYAPFAQLNQGLSFVVRTRDDPAELIPTIRAALTDVDRTLPIAGIDLMADLRARSYAEERYRTFLMVLFGVLATVLAAVGMFGVTSRAVSRRTREVGIRMALGASAKSVSGLIVSQTLRGVTLGVAIGVLAALAATRLLTPFLYGVSATDPLTYLAILALLGAVSVLASWIPARRAVRGSLAELWRD